MASICSFKTCFEFDKRIQLPAHSLYVGATMSGKTTLFFQSLENVSENYNPAPTKIIFLYQCFQKMYITLRERLTEQGVDVDFIQAVDISEEDLKTFSDSTPGQIIIAVDDSTIATSKSSKMAHLFTIARHYRCSLVLFWHVLFTASPQSRIISQNTAYIFLLSSPRMVQQVKTLGIQLNRNKELSGAYEEVLKRPHNYILVDLSVKTPDFLRIRSKVFKNAHDKYFVQEVFVKKI